MSKMAIYWEVKNSISPDLNKYKRYLRDRGYRPSTIDSYVSCLIRYLHSGKSVDAFLDDLHGRKLSGSTIDNYISTIKKYHDMLGTPIELHYLKRSDGIPFYFDEEEISKIFYVCNNIKHRAMLSLLFYAGLRASELCNLDDDDLDLKSLTLRIRDGKGGKSAVAFLTAECGATLREYFRIRPQWR